MSEKAPPPFTAAWHMQRPPERLARIARRFERKAEGMTPAQRRIIEKHGHMMPLEVAEQLDRDLARLLPTYGTAQVTGSQWRCLEDLAEDAKRLAATYEGEVLAAALADSAARFRQKWHENR
ncbi:hypothetical protein [Allosediminivita pacifica]|uniref:Uncharacterized protein n=1 Tax=Allosediminivita pacifica TaxID=1267769 RepID=A0A2T6A2S2_9RHOB|nr:hypothetical protein [Allosediminivita pacifica]PTX38112.1 hypothetical protein C8N44_1452 [Allosediminivita pacifica]GGB29519.1 hypothetical protein GCM10011324_43830 [Allosediminivita pacifica]